MMPGDSEPLRPSAPANAPPSPADVALPGPVVMAYPAFRWYHKAGALLLSIFCMAVGIFLIIYPWTESWEHNYFAALVPEWHQYWENLYVRGAVTGLGFVNFYISLAEVIRLRRFSRH